MAPHSLSCVTVVAGPPASGKTAAALAEYAAALRRGPCLWVSTSRSVAAAVREALVDAAGAVLDPGVTTFAGLADHVARRAPLAVRTITPLQRRRLVGRVIEQAAAAGRLTYFLPVAGAPGLAGVIDHAIADLERRGLAPADVRRPAGDDPRRADVALLYAAYRERLSAAHLVDGETLLEAAAAALAADAGLAGGLELVVVDGFTEFTANELRLLEQLACRTGRMIVTLPGDDAANRAPAVEGVAAAERSELFARPGAAAAALVRFGAKEAPPAGAADAAWPALAHLERNLFRRDRDVEPVAPDAAASLDRLHIVAASGVQAEIVEIARRVKRLLVAGAAPGDVVVAFRNVRDLAERVRTAFDDYGIPASIDAPPRLAATALVRSLVGALRLASSDWPYRDVLRLATDRTLRVFEADAAGGDGGDAEPDPRTAIERCVRFAQIPSGRAALFGQLGLWARQDDENREPTAADAALAHAALGRLAAALDVLPRRADVEGWVAALGPLAERLGLLRPASPDDAANWSILIRGLRAAGRIDEWTGWGEGELSAPAFVDLVVAVAAESPAAQDDEAAGRVRVLSAEAARHTRPRHLVAGGLSEQSFPAPRPAAVLDDLQLDDGRADEMLLFYQLVTRPTQSLTLSYPALDERAQALPPSPYLVELQRALAGATLDVIQQPLNYGQATAADGDPPLARSELRRAAVGRALRRERGLLASLANPGGQPRGGPPAAGGVGQAILAGIEAVAHRARREFSPFEGVTDSPLVAARMRDMFGPGYVWSPSRLERYAACPFLFFGVHLLQLQPTPELVLASDVRRRGSVLHATLAHLYATLEAAGLDADALRELLVEKFGESLAAAASARPGRGVDGAIREIERRQIAAWAADFARQDADYRAAWNHLDAPPEPRYFEARFGPGSQRSETESDAELSTNDPFTLQATIDGAAETVQFTGQVDRIDVGRVGEQTVFNVIDYKTSAQATVKDADIHAGRQIQLPLYAMAVEELLLARQGAAALSAGYWSVRGKGYRAGARSGGPLPIREAAGGALRPAPGWATTRAKLIAKIGELIAGVRRGEFPVSSADPECTQFCELRTICRIAQVRSLEKPWPAPARAPRQGADADPIQPPS